MAVMLSSVLSLPRIDPRRSDQPADVRPNLIGLASEPVIGFPGIVIGIISER